jgi:beta-glucosidase
MHQIPSGSVWRTSLAVTLVLSALGCRPTASPPPNPNGSGGSNTGGSPGMGGSPATGGNVTSSGGSPSGGSPASGGDASGGANPGGSPGTGGGPGGSGGADGSGGTPGSGGSGGGSPATGGSAKSACKDATLPPDPKMPGYGDLSAFTAKAATTVANMSIADKAQQMRGTDPGSSSSRNWTDIFRSPDNTTKGIRGFLYRDGPRGVNLDAPIKSTNTVHGKSTVFPVPMARGATFDTDLEYRIGQAMGDEMVASGQTLLLAPTTNILRHPLWGRAQETYGEDSFLLGKMGTASVAGIQEYVPACAKHYAGNNIENLRASKNAKMDEQTLWEVYGQHFEMMIKDGGVACVMAAYNPVNGENCTQSKKLLTTLLRDKWGFQGFVISDWWAIPGGSSGSPSATTGATAINAGMDLEAPWNWHYSTIESMVPSSVASSVIDTAVKRILTQKYRFKVDATSGAVGLKAADTGFSGGSITKNEAHIDLAEEAALKSMVLLKNTDNTLPIASTVKKIAVVGAKLEYWSATDNTGASTGPGINNKGDDVNGGVIDFATGVRIGDVGSSRVNFDATKSFGPFAGIKEVAPAGVTVTSGNSKEAAADADFVVVVAGLTPYDEGEEYNGSGDRNNFALDGKDNGKGNAGLQNKLITDVASLGKPMVVILEGGSVIDMPWLDKVPAVVMAWYPGMMGGKAMGRLLFGQANFSGKLPITWPKKLADLPPLSAGTTTEMDYYLGYRYYEKQGIEPQYPLGYGLSYTSFAYSNLNVPCSEVTKNGVINVTVDVANTGSVKGDESVLLFVAYPDTTKRRSAKELKGFARVSLDAGAKKTVTIPVRVQDLKYYDAASDGWQVEAGTVKIMVGPNVASLSLSDTVTVK